MQHNIINCIEVHQMSPSLSVCRHLQANLDHWVDLLNPKLIGNDDNWQQLQILEFCWSKKTNQSWMQTSCRWVYAFLTCNRASGLTHDTTRHHHQYVSSWVMWLCVLHATMSLPKQPFAFFICHSTFFLIQKLAERSLEFNLQCTDDDNRSYQNVWPWFLL